MSVVPDVKITYCMVTFNRLDETKKAVRHHAPFVDRVIIIDGGSKDGSRAWFESEECKKYNLEYQVSLWVDDPPGQRTKYLDLIDGGWVLVTDCDEYLELPALYQLRHLTKQAEDKGCTGVAFVSHDIQYKSDGSIWDSKSSYYNRIFFKAHPGMRYVGHTHVGLARPGLSDACLRTEYKYYHIKAWEDMYIRGCRNYWTTGVCTQNASAPEWEEFKEYTKKRGFKYFYEFFEYMKKGNIDPVFKKWFVGHRDDTNPESRSWFTCYFVFMHPEENVDKIANKDAPYIPDRKPVSLIF